MKTVEYEVELGLNTPAFLGGAEQKAEWRTPPLKALLRQMWRLAVANQMKFRHQPLREQEARLFGAAASDARFRSRVVLALERWELGKLTQWNRDLPIEHPEVHDHSGKARQIGAHLYLGYGPLNFDKQKTALNGARTALDVSQVVTLRICLPDDAAADIARSLQLAHLLGTIGGRSRNGWGSLRLGPRDDGLKIFEHSSAEARKLLDSIARPWRDCLALDWPHALGKDQKGLLLWRTKTPYQKWSDVMAELARLKIAFRTQFPFKGSEPHVHPLDRHVLAYPVTHHKVSNWRDEFRAPNQLRFKVIKDGNGLRGLIAHMPWLHAQVGRKLAETVWPKVHGVLDSRCERVFP